MKKKLLDFIHKHGFTIQLVFLALIIPILIWATVISSSAYTATERLPTKQPTLKLEYVSLRTRSVVDNTLFWANFDDSRNFNEDMISTGYSIGYQTENEFYIDVYSSNASAVQSIVPITGTLANDSVIVLKLESFAISANSPISYDLSFALRDTNGDVDLGRGCVFNYDLYTVNNVTGAITKERKSIQIPKDPGSRRYNLTLDTNGTYRYFDNAEIRLNYQGTPDYFEFASGTDLINSIEADRRLTLQYLGYVDGTFNSVDIPDDWFGWIVNGVNSFMSFEILPNVTLMTVVYALIGISLFIFIFKKFAGG